MGEVSIEASWKEVLNEEFSKAYFQTLASELRSRKNNGDIIYPKGSQIFNAFNSTPFDQLKVVVIGQDPYHGPEQAMGMSFSVPRHIRIPPSLKNIYKELKEDLGLNIPEHGDLSYWAQQGVFLLNAVLTVEHKKPGSHKKLGWQEFTDAVIAKISEHKDGIVFLLWGNFARSKKSLIDESKHHVLEAAHPSPLAGGAFFGNKHFSKTNELLTQQNKTAIDWQIR